jgi:hypothetical protein
VDVVVDASRYIESRAAGVEDDPDSNGDYKRLVMKISVEH